MQSMVKPNLVMLPGAWCDESLFSMQKEALSGVANLIFPDITRDVTITDCAKRLLKELPEKFFLAGFSLGGIIALEMHYLAPQRIQGLMTVSSRLLPLTGRLLPLFNQYLKDLQNNPSAQEAQVEENLARWFPDNLALRLRAKTMASGLSRSQISNQLKSLTHDFHSRIGPLNACPVCLVWGEEDLDAFKTGGQALREKFPGANIELIPGAKHFVFWEAPEKTNNILKKFLKNAL